jgi:methionyl-tRNA synthetase
VIIIERVTITSALPYVNGVKHLGNIAGSLLPADIFHRFLDLFGVDNIFICGTDDHGTAVEIGAEKEGISPQEYAKKYYEIQKEIYGRWNFDFTHFGHTSSSSNKEITQEIFTAAYNNGYILKKTLTVPFCNNDKRYLPDRFTIGTCPTCNWNHAKGDQCEKCGRIMDPTDLIEPRCAICGKRAITFRDENHLFMDFGALQGKLRKWIEGNTHWADNTRNLALGWIKEGLKPRCITRNLNWGIKVPLTGYEHLVFYVWFDAPIGYISITKDGIDDWKEWWTDSKIYHFIGKDNVPFHTIFWPGTLIASGKYTLPHHVVGYEYLNWEGDKFSTSRGVGLFSDEALDLFPSDYWRFYLSSILPENKDSNFDWNDFQSRINSELIANFGNLFYRATYFIETYFDGKVPEAEIGEEEQKLQWEAKKTIERVRELVNEVKLREALREILAFSSQVNKYFQDSKPWETVKTDKDKAARTLYTTVNLLHPIALLLRPFIPNSSDRAIKLLDTSKELTDEFTINPSHRIKAEILFQKIEDADLEKVKRYKTKYVKKDLTEKNVQKPVAIVDDSKIEMNSDMLPFNEFQKVEMKVGTIRKVEDHPKADKLYVLQVDLGHEHRQIVAGLRTKYTKDELDGKQVIIVANLEPKELRGVKSHGMLLAADDGTILCPSAHVPNGSKIM